MQVQFLGITGSIQQAHSGNVSLLVSHASTRILVDVSGSPVQGLALCGVAAEDLTHLVLTHAHVDHIYALPSLLHQLWLLGRKTQLEIMGNRATIAVARQLCAVFGLEEKKQMFPIKWISFEDGNQSIVLGSLDVRLFPTTHGVPTLGCLFSCYEGSILYAADSSPLARYPDFLQLPTLLIHEAGGLDSEKDELNKKGHSTALQAASVAKTLGAGCLLLCHLPEQEGRYAQMVAEAQCLFSAVEIPTLFQPYGVQSGTIVGLFPSKD